MPIIECNERSKNEIYETIVFRIKLMYKNQITDSEAQEAARNLINFCQEIVEYKAATAKDLKEEGKL